MSSSRRLVLTINALCEAGMGLGFLLLPDAMIPDLTDTGRTTTRVFGCSLLALSFATHQSTDYQTSLSANLFFHIAAGVVLGSDVLAKDSSPFVPPTFLHIMLSVLLIATYCLPKHKAG